MRPAFLARTSIALFLLCAGHVLVQTGTGKASAVELRDSELSDLVKRAYVYSFPVYEMYRTRYGAVYDRANPNRVDLNQFRHERKLSEHTARAVTTPNNDTLYSSAWLDLSLEPVILSVPDTGQRYYSMAFMDFYTNNFAYVGRRVTGNRAGDYMVVGPKWTGMTPIGLTVIESPTDAVWLLGRTLVEDEADLAEARKIQDQYKLTPLSVWTKSGAAKVKTDLANPPPGPDPKDPWHFFKIANLGLSENPPPSAETPLMVEFSQIGVGPNKSFDLDGFTEEQRKVLRSAIEEAANEIRTSGAQFFITHQGWSYARPHLGNYGKDYPYRALIALVGLAALEPAEATYMTARTDKDERPLSGENLYRLHFPGGALPPVDAFWSLSLYEVMPDQRAFFVDNPIHRYAIGDRTKGLKFNNDGSLDIFIQRQSPGKDLKSNWLPTPSGPFRMTLRAYQPRGPILNGEYTLPGIQRID